MITTTSHLPPLIKESFSKPLLCFPRIKFNEDEEDLYRWYKFIKKKIKNENQKELEKKFLEIYAQIEKEIHESKIRNETQEPFYRITLFNRSRGKILEGIKRKAFIFKYRGNDDI
jgi:hypothetical protein